MRTGRDGPTSSRSSRRSSEGDLCFQPDVQPNEARSEEHTSELQSQSNIVCRLLLEKKKIIRTCTSCVRSINRDIISSRTMNSYSNHSCSPTSTLSSPIHRCGSHHHAVYCDPMSIDD